VKHVCTLSAYCTVTEAMLQRLWTLCLISW